MDFLKKQLIDVIDWTEPEPGILAWRYPMQDREIQNGGHLTVRESQMAVFINEGKLADTFGPGLYTLNTQTLPILTYLKNWNTGFQSPFKSDVYFFSTRQQLNQKWGTATPVTIRDKDFGAVRFRAYGIYAYHIADPKAFHTKISGTQELYRVEDLEGQLRNSIVTWISNAVSQSGIPFLDMASNQVEFGKRVAEYIKPQFVDMGLSLDTFMLENISLPDELQKMLDTRMGMNMIGDMGRYTQFQVANSLPIAAANTGGGAAGIGAGLGAGMGMAQVIMGSMGQANQQYQQPPQQQQPPPYQQQPPQAPPPPPPVAAVAVPVEPSAPPPVAPAATPAGDLKFCINCGSKIPRAAKFCAECGSAQ
jgi:membrane protease subunit (stomatin/prohibitin family)